MNEFGSHLKRLRQSKRLGVRELGRRSGVSYSYISLIENGKMENPSPEMIRWLSIALGVAYIGMMIKAGYLTEEEVLTYRQQHGIKD